MPKFDPIPEQGMEDSFLGYFDDYFRKVVKNVQIYEIISSTIWLYSIICDYN